MNFEELNKLVKFCYNRINQNDFLGYMREIYNDDNYASKLWTQFRDNPTLFIVSRGEAKLLELIAKDIEEMGYKG